MIYININTKKMSINAISDIIKGLSSIETNSKIKVAIEVKELDNMKQYGKSLRKLVQEVPEPNKMVFPKDGNYFPGKNFNITV